MYNPKPYTPLVHWHLRFYFSAPYRTGFRTELAKKQFHAVKNVLSELSDGEVGILRAIIAKPDGYRDLEDTYIQHRLAERGMSEREISRFYSLLQAVDKRIAIALSYIDDE